MNNLLLELQEEQKELNEKMFKLGVFLGTDEFEQINSIQQSLLKIQYGSMLTYERCLIERMNWLSSESSS